jgi:sialic acid synthase SpsE
MEVETRVDIRETQLQDGCQVMKSFRIDRFLVDDGEPPLFFPDIGTFFNQDMAVAEAMVKRLHAAGADLIKGEILHDAEIALDDDTCETYLARDGKVVTERTRAVIKRKVVSLDSYERLFRLCQSLEIGFLLSIYDFRGAEFARDIGACALKIASSNIVHRPLIEYTARTGLPMIIDTGKATLEEIARAVQWAEDAGAEAILIQHSPEAPPSPLANHNLRMLTSLRQVFDRPVGLSDHHAGEEMLYAAVALGAHAVEKGIVPDGMTPDQDVYHAMPISMFEEVLAKCKRIQLAIGTNMRYLRRDSKKHPYRMGIAAAKDLRPGDTLTLDNVHFSFPNKGIPVEHWEIVEGWRVRGRLIQGQLIRWQDVEPHSS